MSELEVGSRFGRYRIDAVLGRGMTGAVYLAADTNPQLQRKVALKVLKRELGDDEAFRERFLRESLMAVELDHHPNIVPVYDAGETDGLLYIAMRHIDGTDLGAAIASYGPIPADRAVSIITQVASALDLAHSAGLVHRDVKPGNILLSRGPDHVYLADFGISKRVTSDSKLTRVGELTLTPSYASPEQISGEAVDARADVYALGCVLYECLTARPPFEGETVEVVMAAHLTRPVPSVAALRPDVPMAIDVVIANATAKSPDQRYQSAGQFADATTRALNTANTTEYDRPAFNPGVTPGAAAVGGAAAASFPGPGAGSPTVGSQPMAPGQVSQPGHGSWPQGQVPTGAQTRPPSPPPTWPPGQGVPGPSAPGQSPGTPSGPPGASWPPGQVAPPGSPPAPPGGSWPPGQGPPNLPPTGGQWSGAPTQKKRSALPFVIAAVVVLVLVVGVGILVAGSGGGGGDEAFPSQAEKSLLSKAPGEFVASECQRDTTAVKANGGGDGGSLVAIRCTASGGADAVAYVQFPSNSAADAAFDDRVDQAVDNVDLVRDSDDDCIDTDAVEHEYTTNDGVSGRVLCYRDGGSSYIVWSAPELHTVGTALRRDRKDSRLYEFWSDLVDRDESELDSTGGNAMTDISTTESELLEHVPGAIAGSCVRREEPAEGAVAALECEPDSGAALVIYQSFGSVDDMTHIYGNYITNSGVAEDSGEVGACPREGTYSVDDVDIGRVLCFVKDGYAFIVWTDDQQEILSVAAAAEANVSTLNDWWVDDSGPIP